MPFYVYSCSDCKQTRAIQHGIESDVKVGCDHCGNEMIKKPSLGGVSFRGDGWGSDR